MMKLKWMVGAAVAMFFLTGVAFAGVYPTDNGAAGYAGATLPEKVINLELQNHTVFKAKKGYNSDGEEVDAAASVKAQAQAVKINYGIKDWLAFQIGFPWVVRNKRVLQMAGVRKTDDYAYYKDQVTTIAATAPALASGVCTLTTLTSAACVAEIAENVAFINQGYTLTQICAAQTCSAATALGLIPTLAASDSTTTLLSGDSAPGTGTYFASVNEPVNNMVNGYTDHLVELSSPQNDGKHGIGDMEIGALAQLIGPKGILMSDFFGQPIALSFGAAFRLPTGSFGEIDPTYVPTGDGSLDFGIRTDIDYNPLPGLVIAWENDIEKALTKPKRADYAPISHMPVGTESTYEYQGLRFKGYFKIDFGFKPYVDMLKVLGLGVEYSYDYGHKVVVKNAGGGEVTRSGSEAGVAPKNAKIKANVHVDLKQIKLPVDLQLQYWKTQSGVNQAVAPDGFYARLRLYYKF